MSVDPVAVRPIGDNFNRYWYANNNPYKFTDPDGRDVVCSETKCTVNSQSKIGEIVDWGTVGLIYVTRLIQNAVADLQQQSQDAPAQEDGQEPSSPEINPGDVAGKTPGEIDGIAKGAGLLPKGPDPAGGRGAYVDPVTGKQRILVHPDADCGPHCHVNDSDGNRQDIDGNRVSPESPEAHLPLDHPPKGG